MDLGISGLYMTENVLKPALLPDKLHSRTLPTSESIMLAEGLLRKRDANREIAKKTRQKRFKSGYKGLICYVDKDSHAFLRRLQRETDTSSLSDVILNIIRERQARSR